MSVQRHAQYFFALSLKDKTILPSQTDRPHPSDIKLFSLTEVEEC